MARDITGTRPWIVLLGLASGLSAFGMASVLPTLPALAVALDANYASLQFIVSAYLLGLGLAQPVQGLLCDRFGRRPVLLAGFAVFAVASVAASVASSLVPLILARFMQAVGVSVGTVASRAMVRDTHDVERAAVALSFITAVMGVAPIVAPIAGGAVTSAWGWRAIFLMHSTLAVGLLVWAAVAMRETRPGRGSEASFGSMLTGFGELMKDRHFLGYTMIYGFSNGGSFAFITVGAALFQTLFAVSAAQFGLLWAVFVVAYSIGAFSAGTLARRYGSRSVMRFGIALTLAGGVLFVAAALWPQPSLIAYMVAIAIFTGANGVTAPLALAGAVSGQAHLIGLASGLSSALAMLTAMVFAAISGFVYDDTPTGSATLLGLAALLTWVAHRTTLSARPA